MMILILLLVTILNFNESLSEHTHSNINKRAVVPRIYAGLEADDGDYPFIALLHDYRDRSNAFCGGSVIHEKWILTAGHCLADTPRKITVGSNWASGYSGQSYEIYETFIPKGYTVWADVDRKTGKLNKYYSDNDVGLVQLKTSIDLNRPYVSIIPIDTVQTNYDGKETIFMGWGKTQKEAYSQADRLQYAQGRVMNTVKCQEAEPAWVIKNELHICTESNSTICPGDSGGPLIDSETNKQIGIANHATCGAKEPSVFQRVSAHYQWIKKTIEEHGDTFSNE